jgi:hypothetical protein
LKHQQGEAELSFMFNSRSQTVTHRFFSIRRSTAIVPTNNHTDKEDNQKEDKEEQVTVHGF